MSRAFQREAFIAFALSSFSDLTTPDCKPGST